MQPLLLILKKALPKSAKKTIRNGVKRARKTYLRVFSGRHDRARFAENFLADEYVNLLKMPEFRAKNFPQSGPTPWLDRADAEVQIQSKVNAKLLSAEEAELCRKWSRDGYVILQGVFEPAYLDRVWNGYEAKVKEGKIPLQPEKAAENDPHPGRWLNPHRLCNEIKEVWEHPRLLKQINLLLGTDSAPFQTITSHKGSQQKEHSDSIHMSTYPQGFMCASWTAFEDIHPDSGPLIYYPGSHRLPYHYTHQVGIEDLQFEEKGYAQYSEKYEPFIQSLLQKHKFEPKHFLGKKGDVLIWHANLLHGGSVRKDIRPSRKALVCHYFAKKAFCYHDLAGTAADLGKAAYYL